MATEVIMPKVDMVMETGTFEEWLKKEGDHVNKGDPLFIITTDKASIELESPGEGTLAGVKAKTGDVIPVTEVIAYILVAGEALPAKAAPQPAVTLSLPSAVAAAVEPAAAPGKVRATPVARRLAQDLGVDLALVTGRGPRGRIHRADVSAFQKPQLPVSAERVSAPARTPAPVVPALPARPMPASLSVPTPR